MVERNELPNMAALINSGASGVLKSTDPPMTPLAWPSIVSGANPGKHGIYDFFELDRANYTAAPINVFSSIKTPVLWDIFNQHGKPAGIFNFPLAYPPPQINSFFVSGAFSPRKKNLAFPPELNKFINKRGYRANPSCDPTAGGEDYYAEIISITENQCEIALKLIRQYDCEMYFIVFQGLDWLQHYLWGRQIGDRDAINQAYRFMDRMVGRIINEIGEDWNTLVISDHGFTRSTAEIHLNSLLEEWGYLKKLSPEAARHNRPEGKKIAMLRDMFSRVPSALKQGLKSYLPEILLDKLREVQRRQRYQLHLIDWSRTKAFSYGYMGRVFIHSAGDYSRGIVSPGAEYQKLRADLSELLQGLKNPDTGERIVAEVFSREDLYRGGQLKFAPDIIFNPVDYSHIVYGDFGKTWINELDFRLADHDPDGVFIFNGPGVKRGFRRDISVVDITPTVLYLHDLPVPGYVDGRVPQEVFEEGMIAGKPIRTALGSSLFRSANQHSYSPSEQRKVVKHLENMGYI